MRNYFLTMTLLALAIVSVQAHSETLEKEAIPQKIMDQIYKKHPNAMAISAEQKKHFGQDLYEIKFKEKVNEVEENQIKFYRTNGQFYVDGVKIDTSENANMLPTAGNDSLKSAFSKYDIANAVMIVNPNGAGEEYELLVNSEGVNWQLTMDKEGKIVSKERD